MLWTTSSLTACSQELHIDLHKADFEVEHLELHLEFECDEEVKPHELVRSNAVNS